MAKIECLVIIAYDYYLWCKIENNYYLLKQVEHYKNEDKKDVDNQNSTPKVIKKYIPPKEHP